MPIDCLTAAMRLGQQIRRVWWGNALRGKVPANVQIRRVFPLLDCLMLRACIASCFLLSSDVIIQFSVSGFKLASSPRNVFFHRRKFRFCGFHFFRGQPRRFGAAEARPDQFCPLFRKPRQPSADTGRSRLPIGRSPSNRMKVRRLFAEDGIGGFAFPNTSFYGAQFALADVNVAFRLVAPLEKWLFFRVQFSDRLSLFARILLPFFFDLFYSFFDPRDTKCDFLLFLLQLFKSDNLIAQFGKIGRLGSALAPQVDFALLQKTLLMTKRHARSLASDFQSDLAKACANETHG